MFRALLKTMRPRQWPKNIFLFAALVFDKQLLILNAFLRTAAGFVLFCLISSAVYIFNDIADIEADREHPEKKNRPIPSGKLPIGIAWVACILLLIVSLTLGYWLSPDFATCVDSLFSSEPGLFQVAEAYPHCGRTSAGRLLRLKGGCRCNGHPCRTVFTMVICGHDAFGTLSGLR